MQKQALQWCRNGYSNRIEIHCFCLSDHSVKSHTQVVILHTESECWISDFDQGKSLIKEREDCSFSKMTGDKITAESGVITKYLQCNRGGSNRRSREGTRRGQMQGSCIFNHT